jgi:hypothetical protein
MIIEDLVRFCPPLQMLWNSSSDDLRTKLLKWRLVNIFWNTVSWVCPGFSLSKHWVMLELYCWNSMIVHLYQIHYIVELVINCLHCWPILQLGQGNVVLKLAHRTLEALVGSHFSHLMMICSSPISTGLPRVIVWNWTQSFSRVHEYQ